MGKRASAGGAGGSKKVKSVLAQSKTTPQAEAEAALAEQQGDEVNMCSGIIGKVHDALKVINEHSIFKNIVEEDPLSLSGGGSQAPFSQPSLSAALSGQGSGGTYMCGGNYFWQNFTWLANHRLPINPGTIKELQTFSLKPMAPPRHFAFQTVFAVETPQEDVAKAKGALQRVSPPEPALAVIFSIQDAIAAGAADDVLMAWRRAILSAPVHFEVCAKGEDRFWRSQNLRQEAIEMGDVAQLSTRQWIYDVVGYKAFKEKELNKTLGSAQVATFYAQKMHYAKSSDQISHAFVDSALTVFRRVLCQPIARRWLEWCEENMMGQSPWAKSIYAMQALVDRAQTPHRIGWAVWGLTDLYRMELINLGAFSVAKLKDYRQSYIEVLNLKHALRGQLLDVWLPSLGLPQGHVKRLQEVFADFESVRQWVTAYPGQSRPADTTWMVGWSESSRAAADVIEDMVYTVQWDQRFKDAIRSKLKIEDFLDYESVRAALDHVKDLLTQERSAAATAATAEEGGAGEGSPKGGTAASAGTADAPPPTTGFASMCNQDQNHWDQYIRKQLRTYVHIIPETKSMAELEHAIRESTLANIRGDPTGLVLYYYDVKMHGEPATRPELRIAPFRDAIYHKLVRAVLSGRCPAGAQPALRTGEVAVLLDGGRHGNATKLLAPWREGTGSKKDEDCEAAAEADGDDDDDANSKRGFVARTLNLVYTEESILARRKRVRGGTGSIRQSEWAHMLAHARIALPERQRKHFPGSTSGDSIYGIGKPDLAKEWTVSWKDKKEMYGKRNLIPVGGKTEGADPDAEQPERKTDTTEVPVAYHGMPSVWYEELIHTFFTKSVVDLTPVDGRFAWQALVHRVGYVGIAFTPKHADAIYKRLMDQIKEEMCLPASRMFNAQYARAAGVESSGGAGAGAGAGGGGGGSGTTQPPRGKKRQAAGKAAGSGVGGGGKLKGAAAGTAEAAGEDDDEGSQTFNFDDEGDGEEVWDPLED